jgi:phosphatidylserine/phosphatidylglycerophosphate/cardiolipin synthase-like enzyme
MSKATFTLGALVAAFLAAAAPPAHAEQPAWHVCFTPGQDCTGLVVAEIDAAQRAIRVQANSFTSIPILSALKAAHTRGVDVEVIVDKTSARVSKSGSRYSAVTYLSNAGVPLWLDVRVSIAHNKVMVIDGATVITGFVVAVGHSGCASAPLAVGEDVRHGLRQPTISFQSTFVERNDK